ncbi:activating signal cointegrator 1 complex subunit 3 isoform B [Chlorella sorokiniana]|uniref:Radical S-adenosyl methionine domain-containing protein 1, mitochondrial n=1 Tax=Chlorella sorokiniana TaxID=3076 RepID=A0A2P6TFR0_CHLSO|nr:activating signal cointegrator 1 complex subunit 3 isoform B [Chlorella sorokiniana]|eukprot:PRW32956.1 activating signal cointegrator 1 complex subunit 3 isoform B [Chlorella sorokiniana]
MGRGGGEGPGPAPMEVPRLSSMLRAALGSGALPGAGSGRGVSSSREAAPLQLPDLQQLLQQRGRLLEGRRRERADMQVSSARSELVAAVLGSWAGAPKAARDEFEKYIRASAHLLGGESSSEEVAAAATVAWRALMAHPPDTSRGRAPLAALAKARSVIEGVLGRVEDAPLLALAQQHAALQRWQQQFNPAGSTQAQQQLQAAKGKTPPPGFGARKTPAVPASGAAGGVLPAVPTLSLEEAVLAVCGVDAETAAAAYAAAAGEAADSSAARAALAAALAPKPPPRVATAAETAAVEAEVFGAKGRVLNAEAGARWLIQWCTKVTGGASGGDDTVATAVCRLLLSGRSDDEIAAELFDLLGDSVFEHIGELLQQRASVAANVRRLVTGFREADAAEKAAAAMPSYGSTVTVVSESQKLMHKLERKAQRRAAGKGGGSSAALKELGDEDADWVSAHGLLPLVEEEVERETAHMRLRLGDGVEFRIGEGSEGLMARGTLPKGTSRKTYKGYEEVKVPAVRPAAPPPGEELVEIEALPEWAQLAFAGYKTLNRIQSRIFQTAFTSNENMLVCAPTGAGKTNIAMLSVLREVGANMAASGVIQKADFKIVYVAPMKALAAEVTANFGKRLAPLGLSVRLSVRELTGDMQLSKKELAETQMIVTTPEKWDVITRKGGEVSVAATVRLLIIDEVHLLNDERGPVIETLVARTTRQVESSQSMIRIVGLSATLPNYRDVARFLGVNNDTGLFYFDASYRPVPLEMQFVGVSERNVLARLGIMDEVCYQKVTESLKRGFQAMVFVHSRKDTGKTARTLMLKAQQSGETNLFDCTLEEGFPYLQKEMKKSRNREIGELFEAGLGIHHAGMLRSDRSLMERAFAQGIIKVLCCTATLAWGVNLPAHTVIIKGTQLYNPQKGGFTDLGMLDVQQIFGRAGRPQYQDTGEGIIITTHDKLAHYLGMLTHQVPIESQFTAGLVDHLNAEIVLGTVTNVREASQWMSYTYLYTRMTQNPLAYGVAWEELSADPRLEGHRRKLITDAARELHNCHMARFDERSGNLYVTELGRVASHYYIRHSSILVFNEHLKPHMTEADVLSMIAQSSEFENLAVREEELPELDTLVREACQYEVKGGAENKQGKANVLLQAYISRARVDSFSLTADLMYVSQNAPRIARALFEICLRKGWSSAAELCLTMSKAFELRLWPDQHPLRQFEQQLSYELLRKLEDRNLTLDVLADMEPREIGSVLRHPAAGNQIAGCVASFPYLQMEAHLHPITRTVLRIQLNITPAFNWKDSVHGNALKWLVWVEDSANEHIYHSETWILTKKMMREGEQRLAFTVPIFEPLPSQYYIRIVSDQWLGAEALLVVSFKGLILPERHPPHTELLDLEPLPLSALGNPRYESLYRFSHFNPIQTQTQAFHTLYHTDHPVLLGAPTGSGKTISAELTMMRLFSQHPGQKVIYIAPLKALVRERIKDWGQGFCRTLGKRMVELTGDYTPDMHALLAADIIHALLAADIIVCTPEKWDGISRNWQSRSYVRKVGLLIIDEIHLLGADRGPILEVIVSRMRYIAAQTARNIRFVGLSTALANAQDLADWLGITGPGLFNFKPSVRPVPLECHIQGYPGKFYCPRMATMNKPAYAAIQAHSPIKPVLIFVSSRRQTRLTALDLLAYAAADDRPRAFLHMTDHELEQHLALIKDASLRHTLQFGIGLHHAGLPDSDREVVERLYVEGKIQVLVATSTLAWGVNTPAHLVIIKGTEFYDAPTKRYVDYPITDVLQMMGRAGRPQFDRHGVAVIMVHEPKKSFYKKFLYEPFPVESSLPEQLADHFNAEVVAGTIKSQQDAVDYLTWTFFIRRLLQNPSYYDLESTDAEAVSAYLSAMVQGVLAELQDAGCLEVDEETGAVQSLAMGRIASFYYMRHQTMATFAQALGPGMDVQSLLPVLCAAAEYDELPVRHNEDRLNVVLNQSVRWPADSRTADDPHTKANLLLQAHLGRLPLPISDYVTDTKGALDNSLRILQSVVDISSDAGWLDTALAAMTLVQSLMQGRWYDDSSLLVLPHFTEAAAAQVAAAGLAHLPQLLQALRAGGKAKQAAAAAIEAAVGQREARDVLAVCERLPVVGVSWQAPAIVHRPAGDEDGSSSGSGSSASYSIEVELQRLGGKGGSRQSPPRVYAPRFPKVKEEGWWLVAGDTGSGELFAIKRVAFGQRTTTKLTFPAYTPGGRPLESVDLLLICDSYLGLDQQYTVGLGGSSAAGGSAAEALPLAARRLDTWQCTGLTPWEALPPSEDEASSDEEQQVIDWWARADAEQLAAGYAARRRQLEQTAHLVTHAELPYAYSDFRDQAQRRGGWQITQVVRVLPASLEGLTLDTWTEGEDLSKAEAKSLAAATSDALTRFPHLTALQLRVGALPKQAAAALAHLTGVIDFEFGRRRVQIDGLPLKICCYREEQQAGGGPPMWQQEAEAADLRRRSTIRWPAGPLQGWLRVIGASLPPGSTLQQLLQRLLPPAGLSFGMLELSKCRFTPSQCGACPPLGQVNELAVDYPRFLLDGYTAAQAEEFQQEGEPEPPPGGSPADLAQKEAIEPVLAALLDQMPALERLQLAAHLPEGGGVPGCIVQHSGLRYLDLGGAGYLKTLPLGPYLQSLETLLLDSQGFERLPRALAAATRCRYLSMELCYHMDITKKDVDEILGKMAALEELRLNKHESWNPISHPLPLLRYMRERLPNVRVVAMAGGGSGLTDDEGSEDEDSSWDREGGSGWDSGGSSSSEDGSSGRARAGSSRQAATATPKPARGHPAAKGRSKAGAAAKEKRKQPAKAKAAAAPKPKAKAKGKGKQGKGKQQQQQQQQARKSKRGHVGARAPAPGAGAGGGSGGRVPPRLAMQRLCLRFTWIGACLLLLALRPTSSRELAPSLPLAAAEEGSVPSRRLQQACEPWPLSFINTCNGTAEVTIRAQLAAPVEPGSEPCLNDASQAGEWCVRTVELGFKQQQLVFPQAQNASFQWYAEVTLNSARTRWWGGNRTNPQTPWFDSTSGQPCDPLPSADPRLSTCKPFRRVNAALENTTCADPKDKRPWEIQCNDLNTTCSTKLLVANNCSLDAGVLVYGALAENVQPGFCVNNSTRRGEWCLRNAGTYSAGTANTAGSYAFEGLYHTGLYTYAWVPRTNIQWRSNDTDLEGMFVDFNTGERCASPANGSCASFFQVSLDSSACGSTATWTLLVDLLQRQPGCKDVPFNTLNATFGDPLCAGWATKDFVTKPCPAACDFGELPDQCVGAVASQMIIKAKGLLPSNATLLNFVNAVLNACAAGEPVGVDAVAAVARDALSPYASCGPDAPTAVASSPCGLIDTKSLSSLVASGTADCQCYAVLKNISLDCYVDYFIGAGSLQAGMGSMDTKPVANVLKNMLSGFMSACEGQAESPAPSSTPQSPLPVNKTGSASSSNGSSAPVGAIVGGLVGAVAAVAVCVLLAVALRRRRRQRVQRATSARKAVDEFVCGSDGMISSKVTSSQALSLASSGSAGMPAALASDPLVSWILASQLGTRASHRSSTSAVRSLGSSGGSQVQAWEMDWADLQLQAAIGSGSYGKVYLAHWGTIPVAVKVLLVPGTAGANLAAPGAAQEALELALPPSALAELEAEAGLLASLRHPCCVNFFGLTRNPPALVTEYCSRGSVAELLDRARAEPAVAAELTWRRRLGVLLDAAVGMVYLHGHKPSPIIHRDLNKAMEDTAGGLSSSVAVTNPRWLAPELMRGEHATQASDMFAFGVVMWELLTWVRPWATTNPWQISSAVLAGRRLDVPDPAELPGPAPSSPGAFAAYVRLMQHCWAQAPADRPSFPEVVQTLRPISTDRLAWLRCAALLHSRAAATVAAGRCGHAARVAAAAPQAADGAASGYSSPQEEQPTAAYVHLPFCKRKCSYCDFPVIAVGRDQAQSGHWHDQMGAYVQLLLREMEASRRLNERPLQSVFFGGGTPSLLSLPLLEQLLQALDRRFGLASGAEISIEADPGTFDAARLRSYMGMGVSRVSVGVQSFQDELLALCGRAHDAADVFRAVEAVHAAGVPSWSLDLMSGLPQLTEEAWGRSLEQAIDAGPHHISTYDLQERACRTRCSGEGMPVEEGTPFARRYSPGEAPLPTDAAAAAMYCGAAEVLGGAGFEHYEVSNYALPGHRCRHNMVYWEGLPYYAFGMGAASYLEGRRFSRPKRLNAYRQWVEQYAGDGEAQDPQVAGSWLPRESGDDRLLDTVMLRLRLADGLDLRQLATQHAQGEEAADIVLHALQPHIARGWVLADRGAGWSSGSGGSGSGGGEGAVQRVRLADPQGFLVSNDIISDCFAAFDITSQDD